MINSVVTEVVEQLQHLPDNLQRKVLEFVRTLTGGAQEGVPGERFLRFAGTIPPDDLQLMREAVEAGCEQVDFNAW